MVEQLQQVATWVVVDDVVVLFEVVLVMAMVNDQLLIYREQNHVEVKSVD